MIECGLPRLLLLLNISRVGVGSELVYEVMQLEIMEIKKQNLQQIIEP